MSWGTVSATLPFTPDSSLSTGLHLYAALGGGPAHRFQLDTGSVGVVVPRARLGPDYQDFDPTLDQEFSYVSSGKVYWGQWVKVPIVLGVPDGWDGTGDYPTADIEVFAVDRPAEFDGGMLGVGFAIDGMADGGPARNPLLHLSYQGKRLHRGYIVGPQSLVAGLTGANTEGFAFLQLQSNAADGDWTQPTATLSLAGDFNVDLPLLVDTGIGRMLLWLDAADRPPAPAGVSPLPNGVAVAIDAPPALAYAFVTGDASNPMVPSSIEWRSGRGVNTGRSILAGVDYLYDADAGLVGFRIRPGAAD